MTRQLNNPNWFQTVTVYAPGSAKVLETIEYGQVWDGSLRGHRNLRRQIVEQVEGLRDSTGLQYILWSPVLIGGADIPLEDRQHITVD